MNKRSLKHFASCLLRCYRRETSARPDDWSEENPSYGHCSLVALALHEYFGAVIYQGEIPLAVAYLYRTGFSSHCWNELDGKIIDFTRGQFAAGFPYDDLVLGRLGKVSVITREELLHNPYNRRFPKNYRLFQARLRKLLAQ